MKTILLTFLLAGPLLLANIEAQQTNRDGVTVPTLEINLYARAINGSTFLADGILQNFNNDFSAAVDNMDVRKFMNATYNLFIKNGNYNLIVERRPNICILDTLLLMLTGTRVAPYRLRIDPSVLNYPALKSVLIDKYLKIETPVSLTAVTNVTFDITTDPLSQIANRFMIVYRMQDPVRFTALTALRNKDNTINAVFKTENENNVNNYSIERSIDGVIYEPIASQMPTANNFGNPYYNFTDAHVSLEAQWYRIKANSISGASVYSKVVKINKAIEKTAANLTVFPNPVRNGIINIVFAEQPLGYYKLQIINSQAQVIYDETVNVQIDSMKKQIVVVGLTTGIYRLSITDVNGKKTVKTIIAK